MGSKNKLQLVSALGYSHDALEKEARDFIKRNVIIESTLICSEGKFTSQIPCCEQCLKAHLLKKAEKFRIDKEKISMLEYCFKCEEGHNGFYLDVNKVVKCRSMN